MRITLAVLALTILATVRPSFAQPAADQTPKKQAESRAAFAQAEQTIRFQLEAPPAKTFPLFGPVEETKWDPSWQPRFIFPVDRTQSADGAIFVVERENRKAVWVLKTYDASEGHVEYVAVTPDFSVAEIDIKVAAAGTGKSDVVVHYRYTAMSAEGEKFVRHWAAEFANAGPHWAEHINRYLRSAR